MRRRTLGVAALVVMANTTFAATASACLMTGGTAHATAIATAGGAHHVFHAASTGVDTSSAVPSQEPRHEQPVPTCCEALAPCTSVVSAETVVAVYVLAELAASIVAHGEFAPASRLVAPDTPPPKA